ncbi:DinB family protein [Mycobacterium sp. pUA109]|uniref:DinB family protein n=1 Tax=Mycobacterium sp. pUA109 TaxID=3238982 RepID=UPI00351BA7BA
MSSHELPPLAGEDHLCESCGLVYRDIKIEDAVEVIMGLPAALREAVFAIPLEARPVRPSAQEWSVNEYVCHLRDVYMASTIRLHRTRTEDRPELEPLFNDLRARRFRYNEREAAAVIDELASVIAGFRDEVDRTAGPQWDRTATRLPGESRTARWLVRQAMHEGVHHLADIRRVGSIVTTDQRAPGSATSL